MANNILVIAPHPDDEAIGCGGTIRKHVTQGDHVTVLFLTSGEKGVHDDGIPCDEFSDRYGPTDEDRRAVREREAGVCSQILGTHKLMYWRYPDGGFDPYASYNFPNETNEQLDLVLREVDPVIIYAPHKDEAHIDHYGANDMLRIYMQTHGVPEILLYEVWTPLQVVDVLEDITEFVDYKRAAIRAYKSQLYNAFDEAILALNHYRGLLHGPNKMYVEAFKRMV